MLHVVCISNPRTALCTQTPYIQHSFSYMLFILNETEAGQTQHTQTEPSERWQLYALQTADSVRVRFSSASHRCRFVVRFNKFGYDNFASVSTNQVFPSETLCVSIFCHCALLFPSLPDLLNHQEYSIHRPISSGCSTGLTSTDSE